MVRSRRLGFATSLDLVRLRDVEQLGGKAWTCGSSDDWSRKCWVGGAEHRQISSPRVHLFRCLMQCYHSKDFSDRLCFDSFRHLIVGATLEVLTCLAYQ